MPKNAPVTWPGVLSGLHNKNVGPYTGVQFDKIVKFRFSHNTGRITRTFRVITYQAYNAMGLIGSEYNGICILDDDHLLVILDNHALADTGWFGVSRRQIEEFNKITTRMTWNMFRDFCDNHPRSRNPLRLLPPNKES